MATTASDTLSNPIPTIYNQKKIYIKLAMNNPGKYDYSFKFILVGDTGVGKTSIISRFVENKFDPNHEYTVGV